MTNNINNATDQAMRYKTPRVMVIEADIQCILCLSDPTMTGWGNGSNSDGGDMIEEIE